MFLGEKQISCEGFHRKEGSFMTAAVNLFERGVAAVVPYVPAVVTRWVPAQTAAQGAVIVTALAAIALLGMVLKAVYRAVWGSPKPATTTSTNSAPQIGTPASTNRAPSTSTQQTPPSASLPNATTPTSPLSPQTPLVTSLSAAIHTPSPQPQRSITESPATTIVTPPTASPGIDQCSVIRTLTYGSNKPSLSVAFGDNPRGTCSIRAVTTVASASELHVYKPENPIQKISLKNLFNDQELLLPLLKQLNTLQVDAVYLQMSELGGWFTFDNGDMMTLVQTCIQQSTNEKLKQIYLLFPTKDHADKALAAKKPFVATDVKSNVQSRTKTLAGGTAAHREESPPPQPVGMKIQFSGTDKQEVGVQIEFGKRAPSSEKRWVIASGISSDKNLPGITATKYETVKSYFLLATYRTSDLETTLQRAITEMGGTKSQELVFHMEDKGSFLYTTKEAMMSIVKRMAKSSVFQNAGIKLVRIIFPEQEAAAIAAQRHLISNQS